MQCGRSWESDLSTTLMAQFEHKDDGGFLCEPPALGSAERALRLFSASMTPAKLAGWQAESNCRFSHGTLVLALDAALKDLPVLDKAANDSVNA